MDLTLGSALANLITVSSTQDLTFMRVSPGIVVDSYLYMKIVGDPRISIPVPGSCSITTGTACIVDADCLAGESCVTVGGRMPKNAPPLTQNAIDAIGNWIAAGGLSQPGY